MKPLVLLAVIATLSACDLPQSYAAPPEPKETSSTTGVTVSGYARVGVSHSF